MATEAEFDSAIRDQMLYNHKVFATNFDTGRTQWLEVGDGRLRTTQPTSGVAVTAITKPNKSVLKPPAPAIFWWVDKNNS